MHPTQFLGLNGLKLAADVGGNPANPPVILLHGGGQTRFSWGETAAALADNGFYVVSLDLRGHGDSDWSPDGVYVIDLFVADLLAVCATLGRPASLIGASLGGLTALLAAGEYATQIATALVLVDVAPRLNPAGSDNIINFMRSAPQGYASLDEAADAVASYLPHRPRPTDYSGLLKNLRPGKDGRLHWHWDPNIMFGATSLGIDNYQRFSSAAKNIQAPTLLVRGGNSEVINDESVRDFLELVPTAEYSLIQGAHHMVAGDRNTAFSAAVIDFIQRRVSHGASAHYD
ncbi:MAG: alpha/beta hydrolase [Sterolibacterium sp.]